MKTSAIKTTVWILIIVELWLLVQVPSVGEALFGFIIGGEVPGTDVVLAPNDMLFLLAGLFVLAAGLIFRKEINRGMQAFRSNKQPAEAPLPRQVKSTSVPPKVVRGQAAKATKARRPSRVAQWDKFLRAAALRCKKQTVVFAALAWKHGKRAAIAASRYARWFAIRFWNVSYRAARKGWAFTRVQSIRFWRWLKPHLERFDRWLGRTLHRNARTAAILAAGSAAAATFKRWVAYARTLKEKYLQDENQRKPEE